MNFIETLYEEFPKKSKTDIVEVGYVNISTYDTRKVKLGSSCAI